VTKISNKDNEKKVEATWWKRSENIN